MNPHVDFQDHETAGAATSLPDSIRAAIVDAARTLFREREYVAVRITDIATRAGLSPTSIYARFASKAALYREIMGAEPPIDNAVRATSRGRRTRENLIEAGTTLFERVGYAEATVGEITEAAGCSTATFYTYFATKEELFRHVVSRQARALFDDLWRPEAERTDLADPRRRLERLCVRFVEGARHHGRVLVSLERASSTVPELHELRTSLRAPFLQRLGELVAGWQSDGLALPEPQPEVSADFILTNLETFATRADELAPADLATLLARSLGLAGPAT